MIREWFVGFHRPRFRDFEGRISPLIWFGHCEIWGYTEDETWLFLDPRGKGTLVRVTHHFEEVSRQLTLRAALCDTILRVPCIDPQFRLPMHGFLTCASICGAMLGERALFPGGLRRKLLAKGAEVIHGQEAEGRSERGSGASAATASGER